MKQKLNLIKIVMILVTILFNMETIAQSCSGGTANIPVNGTISVNGVSVTSNSSGYVQSYASPWSGYCASLSAGYLLVGYDPYNYYGDATPAPWNVTLNFNKAVNDIVILISGAGNEGYTSYEDFRFTTNSGTVSISSTTNCSSYISGNTIYSNGYYTDGGGIFRISSTTPFTRLTMSGNGGLLGSGIGICRASIVETCPVGHLKPAVKNLTNVCPSTTVNLDSAHTGSIPSGSSLRWFTNNSHSGAALSSTQVAQAGVGTYYAFYYNTASACYSTASNPVVVTINNCCAVESLKPPVQNLTNVCPSSTVNLENAHTGSIPSGASLRWFTNNTHSGTPLSGTQITQAGTGTYYAFYYNSGNGGCYSNASDPVVVTINNCEPPCTVENLKPSVQNLSNLCPSSTVNLESAHTGSIPSGTSLRWFTNSNHSGTALSGTQITQAGAGTYYAFYYNSDNGGCYSNASDPVVVTINDCEPPCPVENLKPSVQNLTNVCPSVTVDLSNAHTGTIPGNASIRWFTNNTHLGTPLSAAQVTQAGAGTYYAFYYENDCYSLASNPVNVTIEVCNPSSVADLTIGIRANPATISVGGTSNLIYTFSNIGTGAANGSTITYFIYKPQGGTFTIGTLNQSGWTTTETTTGYFISSNKVLQPGLGGALIVNATYIHNGSNENASFNVNAMVINGSGGETNFSNNKTTTLLRIN